ncbi:Uncharacterised protein [Pseudomonas aeruginosa]|nr:Uncharacterised protein [Pseudomonas aeruginosa]
MRNPWRADEALKVICGVHCDQPQPLRLSHDALKVVLYPQGHIDRAALLDRFKRLHEVEGIQINDGSCP